MKRVSIKDIAQKAGVVPSTVSLVLNGKAKQMRISDELAERIKVLAVETGYQPLQTAVSLRTGKTKTLGLIVEDISNVFFASLAKCIEDEAYALGYKIVYCSTENDLKKGHELIRMLTQQQVDGYLITPSTGMGQDIKNLIAAKKPVVLMDRYFPDIDVPFTLVDNYKGVEIGMEHLFDKGYRSIGFVTVDLEQIQMQEREHAFRDAYKQRGLKLNEKLILKLPYKLSSEEAIERILKFITNTKGLDAVFFATNYIGIHGLESIRKTDLSIPGDLGVVCFDDHDIFRMFTPGITVIKQPIEAIAKSAIQMLLDQLEKRKPATIDLPFKKPEIVIRAST